MSEVLAERWVESPVGRVLVVASAKGVRRVTFGAEGYGTPPTGRARGPAWDMAGKAVEELTAYFAGGLRVFTVPVDLMGTDFQQAVWRRLMEIPMGERAAYGKIAEELGRPGAARAVGLANHDNKIAIIIPCHRVVGADGSMTGYAGGIVRKQWLLEHEARVTGTALFKE